MNYPPNELHSTLMFWRAFKTVASLYRHYFLRAKRSTRGRGKRPRAVALKKVC